jgi:hypothetical protein
LLLAYGAYLLMVLTCGVAIWRGDRPLRLAGAVLLVAWVLSAAFYYDHLPGYLEMIVDGITTLIFIWISMRWRRIWCAVMVALMLLNMATRLATRIDPGVHLSSAIAAGNILAILQVAAMAVAIWLTLRAGRRADEGVLRF